MFILKVLRFTFLTLILILLLGAGLIYLTLRSPRLSQKMVPAVVNALGLPVKVNRLKIARQIYRFPGQLTFQEIKAEISVDQQAIKMTLGEVGFKNPAGLIFPGTSIPMLSFRDVALENDAVSLSGAEGTLQKINARYWAGPVKAAALQSQGINLTKISADAALDPRGIKLSRINASLYEGTLTGSATLIFNPFVYSADVLLADLNAEQLESVNSAVFSQLRGTITLDLEVTGPAGGIAELKGDVRLSPGSQMNAALLGPLVQYIPQKAKQQRLKVAVARHELISTEGAQARLFNKGQNTLTADITFRSQELFLDLHVVFDVLWDGSLLSLLQLVKPFSG